MDIITPQQLWEDYDRLQPVNYTVISQNQTKDGYTIKLFYNGYAHNDTQVRIYARLVLPLRIYANKQSNLDSIICNAKNKEDNNLTIKQEPLVKDDLNPLCEELIGKKTPVIILLSSYEKDIDSVDASFLTNKGYAVLVVDYAGGVGEKNRYTIYPKALNAYWEQDPERIKEPPINPKTSCWYYWTTCVLHSVTFLENCPIIDASKIGIIGVYQGAALVWKSSFCSQIKAGITFFSGDLMGSGEDMLTYKASLDSRAYAKSNFPILINTTTNICNGSFDYLNELHNSSPNSAFCIYPCAERAVSKQQINNICHWFDTIFSGQPAPIEKHNLTVFGSGGVIYCEIITKAKSVKIFYAEENAAAFRNWREIIPQRTGEEKYLAKLEVYDIEKPILVFASLSFENGFEFCTPVTQKKPSKLGAIKTDNLKSRLIYQTEMGTAEFLAPNCGQGTELTISEGPHGLYGICGDELTTYKLGDSRFSGLGSMLQIILSAKHQSQDVEIILIEADAYYKCVRKISEREWTTLSLTREDFRSAKGLPNFEKVVGLKIKGKGIILNSLLWI